MKMIPISEIDLLIMDLVNDLKYQEQWSVKWNIISEQIRILRQTKNKAIPAIPISKIDEKIKDFKAIAKYDPLEDPIARYVWNVVVPTLEDLKE